MNRKIYLQENRIEEKDIFKIEDEELIGGKIGYLKEIIDKNIT